GERDSGRVAAEQIQGCAGSGIAPYPPVPLQPAQASLELGLPFAEGRIAGGWLGGVTGGQRFVTRHRPGGEVVVHRLDVVRLHRRGPGFVASVPPPVPITYVPPPPSGRGGGRSRRTAGGRNFATSRPGGIPRAIAPGPGTGRRLLPRRPPASWATDRAP